MGLILVPSEIISKSTSVKTALSNIVSGYQNVLTQVSNFANDEALQSDSWTKLKEKVLEYHTYIEKGMLVVQESVETDLATLEGSIGSETLDEDELINIIDGLENEKKNCEEAIEQWNIQKNSMAIYVVNSSLCSMIERSIEILEKEIENLNELINTYKKKLEFLYTAEDSTKNIFDASITFLAAMESLINEAGVKISNEKITDSVTSVKWQEIIHEVDEDINVNKKTFQEFRQALGEKESACGYDVVNPYGYMGKYQIGGLALQDIGFKDAEGKWTEEAGKYGVKSDNDFLNNPNAQEVAFDLIIKNNLKYIENYGLDKYLNQTVDGVFITESGLVAASHLVGAGGLNKAFENGDLDSVKDGNGVSAKDYIQLFGGYDISEIK